MSRYYPIHLDLHGRLAVVVGGGEPAARRVRDLLDAGACVRVVWPEVVPELAARAAALEIDLRPRRFRDEDLNGAFLVLSERLDDATHRAVWEAGERRGIPVNVEDELDYCSFVNAAVVRQGDLTFTISTAGRAPALAVRIREELNQRYGPHYAHFLELARRLRTPLAAHHPEFATRKRLWYELVDSDVLLLLEQGDEQEAIQRMVEIMGVEPSPIEAQIGGHDPLHALSGQPEPRTHEAEVRS